MEDARSSDTTGTLLQDSTELLDECMKRCWEDSAAGCKQAVWLLYLYGHIGRVDAIDLARQVGVALGTVPSWRAGPGSYPVAHLSGDPFANQPPGLPSTHTLI
eukprot:1791622-Alexandrium_andersonii.AAC.1